MTLKIALLTLSLSVLTCSAQTGGTYTVSQSVIAGGGSTASASGQFTVAGTAGQNVAGQSMTAQPFTIKSGFWSEPFIQPVIPTVSIGGIVLAPDGGGARNVRLTMTSASGPIATVLTNSFGIFRFDGITVGETYTIRAYSKRFRFAPGTRVVTVANAITDLNFTGLE